MRWKALGVGIYEGKVAAWFGEIPDSRSIRPEVRTATPGYNPEEVTLKQEEGELVRHINAYRVSKGLPALPVSPCIARLQKPTAHGPKQPTQILPALTTTASYTSPSRPPVHPALHVAFVDSPHSSLKLSLSPSTTPFQE